MCFAYEPKIMAGAYTIYLLKLSQHSAVASMGQVQI